MDETTPQIVGVALTFATFTGIVYGVLRWARHVGWNRTRIHSNEQSRYLWDGLMASSLAAFFTVLVFTN